MEAVSRFGPRNEGGGANFIAGNTLNMVQRSRYGKKAPQNMTRDVRPARNLAESASESNHSSTLNMADIIMFIVDPAEKKRIDDKIRDAKVALAVIEEEMQKITDDIQVSRKEDEEYVKNHVRSYSVYFCYSRTNGAL
jgi:hypothetical protein